MMNLIAQKNKLLSQVDTLKERIASNQEIASQRAEGGGDDDVASLYEMQAKAHAAIKIDRNLLALTVDAIKRIDEDEYTFCITCGDDINPKRLLAQPVAKHCIECANVDFHKSKQFA